MVASLTVLRILIALGIAVGAGLAYWEPRSPLLAYWLLLAVGGGAVVSTTSRLSGVRQRAKWLVAINAAIVAVALATTQIAARRAISATHLEYQGVHLVGVRSFTVGVGDAADVQLQQTAGASAPWSIRVARRDSGWVVEPLRGIEQLRLSDGASNPRAFRVSQSTILEQPGDWVAVVDPAGVVVDTLRLGARRLETALLNEYRLDPVSDAISARYRRRLRDGAPLAALDGKRAVPATYERFVRAQELSPSAAVNGERASLVRRTLGGMHWLPARWQPERPLLVSASPPYTLRGPHLTAGPLRFSDSVMVDVRSGEAQWRFQLRRWRREPSADVGLALFFVRNPRPLDTPLPTGVSCRDGAACGAISLRRLPPPVAHVALDYAGFDARKFGLLGRVEQDGDGFTVVLARDTYRVARGASRPVAVPVTPLAAVASADGSGPPRPAYWVLLAASGTLGDDAVTIVLIGGGLALLLAAMYAVIAATGRIPATSHERSLMLGATAILALLLTRVIVGARVAFFAPFLARSIETAIGMWVAIAVVAVGLLSWTAWVPPLLAGGRNVLSGRVALKRMATSMLHAPLRLWSALMSPKARGPAVLSAAAIGCLVVASRAAVFNGAITGTVVLLAWVGLAWVAAFIGPYFETFERGAWSVVEQLAPTHRISPVTAPLSSGRVARIAARWVERIPELPIMAACLAAELALVLPRVAALGATALLVTTPWVVHERRRTAATTALPDLWGALVGVALFTLAIALLRATSENGSMGAFVLVVFVALASVRIGRSVGARLEAQGARTPPPATARTDNIFASLLLIAPLVLLAPLVVIDMGLFLVMVVPVGFATLLAAGWRVAGRRLVIPVAAFALLFAVLGRQIFFPSMAAIRDADSHATRAAAFDRMGAVFGLRPWFVSTPMDRVAARSVATSNRTLAEETLVSAKPGPARDLLIPSIEQIWGAATYASAGLWGSGLGQAVVGGRGVAETVSYAENTFSVFVLAEHGAVGGLLVLALYLLFTGTVATSALAGTHDAPASYRASRALFLVAGLIVAVPASYVALSNLGVVPITGQNMPFLGLNAWSDVAICAGVVGIMITGAIRRIEEPAQ